jgi:cell wall-associated NlpC family hydrolase
MIERRAALSSCAITLLTLVLILSQPRRAAATGDDFSTALPKLDRSAPSSAPQDDGSFVETTMYVDIDAVDVLKEPRDPKDDKERQDLILTQLRRGEKVTVTGETKQWFKVKVNRRQWDEQANGFKNYTEGWVHKVVQVQTPAQPAPQQNFITTYPVSTPDNPAVPQAPVDIPASGCRDAFLNAATKFLGVPYVWGGTSHKGVDCSGLVVASMLESNCVKDMPPRVAADQQRAAIPLSSASQMQPGDLIFVGSPAHHVMIYMGQGQVIEAPHTGTVVNIHAWQPSAGETFGALLPKLEN